MKQLIYLIPVWETIATAWQKTKGSKRTILGATAILFIISLGCSIAIGVTKPFIPSLSFLFSLLTQIIMDLLGAGLVYIAILHVKGLPISFDKIFETFEPKLALQVILAILFLQFLIFSIPSVGILLAAGLSSTGFLGLLLGAIVLCAGMALFFFFYVRCSFALAFILDKRIDVIAAIKSSYRITRHNVLRLICIHLVAIIILLISCIPLLIGLIWTFPFYLVVYALTYSRLLINDKPLQEQTVAPNIPTTPQS